MIEVDGADHARLRGLASHAFTTRRVARLRPRIEELTDRLLDRLPDLAEDGVVDLIKHYAYPVSSTVLCELIGVPEDDRRQWRDWRTVTSTVKGERDGKVKAWREVFAYVQKLIEKRRANPADDLISALVHARADDKLNDTELVMMIVMLGLTSQQATHLIGNGTVALLTHPDQRALLRENPELMPRAVHELLRWCSPTQITPRPRYATEDIDVGGMPVRKGEAVWVVLTAANYDPRRFDHPQRLDITREPDRRGDTHLSFGFGPHRCIGYVLAPMEGEVALERLLRRYPDLALAADPGDLDREPLPGHWRLASLPVTLT